MKNWILAIFSICAALHLNAENANFTKGLTLLEQKKYEEAISSFDIALKESPDNPFCWQMKGYALFCQKNYYDAINNYTLVILLTPKNSLCYVQRALAYHETGNDNAMINDLTIAARMGDPNAINFLETHNISWDQLHQPK